MLPHGLPTVLLIDDELAAVDLYALAIGEHFRVLTARTATDGYALARSEKPDAIVMDMLLPDLHGLELSRRLLDDPQTASIPVIVLTGDDESYVRAAATPFSAVLKKPSAIEDVLKALQTATGASWVS
ncbi:MAG TPA: response regulator [Vicinamibacterales bacterium]|nr:response regulator [Vicinamibacterales bacterium]